MYETYFGFHEKPFSLIPDPDFLYLSEGHRAALSLLEYGITEQTGFVVISGEIGSGKTTLVRRLLSSVSEDIVVGLITNTHPSFGELLQWICLAFDLEHRDKGKVELYQGFLDFLIEQYAASRRTVLVIDEAQNLSPEALAAVVGRSLGRWAAASPLLPPPPTAGSFGRSPRPVRRAPGAVTTAARARPAPPGQATRAPGRQRGPLSAGCRPRR